MITLTFSGFYHGDFVDESYELYIVKDDSRGALYIGISHGGTWCRWFGGAASHMQVDLNGNLRGNSPIGREIETKLPASWEWGIELWTYDDCMTNLQYEGIKSIGGRDVRHLSILDIEAYWIQSLAPLFNTVHRTDERQPGMARTTEAPSVEIGTITAELAAQRYLHFLEARGNANTHRTYSNAIHLLLDVLREKGLDPTTLPVLEIDEDMVGWFASRLDAYALATRKLYTHALLQYLTSLAADGLSHINLPRAQRLLVRQRVPRPISPERVLPMDDIAQLVKFVETAAFLEQQDEHERLRALRDRAFLLTLADTGLRVHEACKLRRGDVDMNEGQALVIGKGDAQAVVRFSARSLRALRDYLGARAKLDGSSGKPLGALPLFARHDKGAGKKVKGITTETGRNIVHERVTQALGETASDRITPHSLRHYFVTTVLRATGNLKVAQEMARHKSMQVTQRYAHLSNDELDKAYDEIFNQRK